MLHGKKKGFRAMAFNFETAGLICIKLFNGNRENMAVYKIAAVKFAVPENCRKLLYISELTDRIFIYMQLPTESRGRTWRAVKGRIRNVFILKFALNTHLPMSIRAVFFIYEATGYGTKGSLGT